MTDKKNEKITIEIDPDTMDYTIMCEDSFVEDIYIVLRELTHSLEMGDLSGVFTMEDLESGETPTREQFIEIISQLKQRVDQALGEQSDTKLPILTGRADN